MIKTLQVFSITALALMVATAIVSAQGLVTSLEVITPSEGQTIYGNKIPILFNIEDFEVVEYSEVSTPVAGQGHIHIWLDDEELSAKSATKVTEDIFTVSDVDYGQHTLIAELVGNTHQSLTPSVETTINFTNATISTPDAAASSGFDKQTALVILIVVALVIVAAWWYTKDEDDDMIDEDKPAKNKTTKKKKKV